jgi:hypothetical protein
MTDSDINSYPEKYWHCLVKLIGSSDYSDYSVVNDLSFIELQQQIVDPWLKSHPFTISGKIVRSSNQVEEIKITHTLETVKLFVAQYGTNHLIRDVQRFPILKGEDYTYDLLFSGKGEPTLKLDVDLVEQLCKRIAKVAGVLSIRTRINKKPYLIEDEYDVQDLLQAILRAYLKYSVQEDPLHKVAGTRSSRADISIEELGIIIELKYVRSQEDQRKIFDDFSKDLLLYSVWKPLETLFFVIYNSSGLRDPESLEKLSGIKEINNKRFGSIGVSGR